jgi:hypothetical protein
MAGRPWTRKEQDYAIRLRTVEGKPLPEIAVLLGRTYNSVSTMLSKQGATQARPDRRKPGELRALVARYARPGVTDCRIARKLKVSQSTVQFVRSKVLGLPPGLSLVECAKIGNRRCRAKNGGMSGSIITDERERFRSFGEGWPFCPVSLRRQLEVLERLGEATTKRMMAEVGISRHANCNMIAAYREGWVVRRKVGNEYFYALSPETKAIRRMVQDRASGVVEPPTTRRHVAMRPSRSA